MGGRRITGDAWLKGFLSAMMRPSSIRSTMASHPWLEPQALILKGTCTRVFDQFVGDSRQGSRVWEVTDATGLLQDYRVWKENATPCKRQRNEHGLLVPATCRE